MAHIFKKSYSEKSLSYSSLLVVVLVDATALREVDLAVDSQEARLLELDPEAEVGEGLNANFGGEPDTGTLRVLDFSDSVQDLRLEPVDVLLVWAPGIVVGGVAPSNAH